MRFELHVSMENSAFEQDCQGGSRYALAGILEDAAQLALGGHLELDVPVRLRDANGNRVGFALVAGNDGGCGDPDCSCPECPTGRENEVNA